MELRDYQIEIANKAVDILKAKKIVYLQMQVRTGKTLTALEVCKLCYAKKVLFLTKKKAIGSIKKDYDLFGYKYDITITNNESMHLIKEVDYDIVIHDESHRFGSIPKPSVNAKTFKKKFSKIPLILLSGTPTPESFSQIYHQFWISNYSPFIQKSFYKWANEFVNVKKKRIGMFDINDYSDAYQDKIKAITDDYVITYTQQQAGFVSEVIEHVLYVEMSSTTTSLIKKLTNDLVVQGKDEVILADTPVKLMQKIHQLCSGTIKFESGNTQIIDDTKALFIKEHFKGKKLAIIYKYKAELELLNRVFEGNITESIDEFNATGKHIVGQVTSIREGTNLSKADYIVFYNLDFSATSYWQAKDRMTTIDRLKNEIYFIFSIGGIEKDIYKSVMKKKNFTTSIFLHFN